MTVYMELSENRKTAQLGSQAILPHAKLIRDWTKQKCRKQWVRYLATGFPAKINTRA